MVLTVQANTRTAIYLIYKRIFCIFEALKTLITDWDRHFTNHLVNRLCIIVKTQHQLTAAYNSQANELVEQVNQTIKRILEHTIVDDSEGWDLALSAAAYAYNQHVYRVTGILPH